MSSSARSHHSASEVLAWTGIPGLNDVLAGGFTANSLYLLAGVPGFGNFTLAMQFRELAPSEDSLHRTIGTPCSAPLKVEPNETLKTAPAEVEQLNPARTVFDSPLGAMRNAATQRRGRE